MKDVACIEKLDKKAVSILDKAKSLVIKNQKDYDRSIDFLKGIKELQEQIEESFGPSIKKAYELHKGLVAEKNRHLEPLKEAERITKGEGIKFLNEQERIRQETQKKLEEEANEQGLSVAPVIPKEKMNGVSIREIWVAEVVDFKLLVKAVAEGKVAEDVLSPNLVVLNKMASALKENLNIPGVKVGKRQILNVRK